MSAADRNKILIAGGVVLLAIIVIVFFVMRGRGATPVAGGAGAFGGGGGAAQTAGGPAQPAGGAAPGQAAPAAPGGAPAGPPAAGAAQAAQLGQAAAGEGGVYVGAIRMGGGPTEHSRPDMMLTFNPPIPPVPPEITANLPPSVLQVGGIRPPGLPAEAGPLGRRRVAGLLFNDGAWAILEQEGQDFIVKPGDIVGGSRITSIGPDSIYIIDADGKPWRVALRSLAASGGGVESIAVPGMPEEPPAQE